MKKYRTKHGFTLVELIVVVTILAILGSIGFISFSKYIISTRDSTRIQNIQQISQGIRTFQIKSQIPFPDDGINILLNGNIIGIQGYAGKNFLESISFDDEGKDPKDNKYYSLYISKDKKYYQILGFLEDKPDDTLSVISTTYAYDFSKYYNGRYPYSYGNNLGIILSSNGIPIQELKNSLSNGNLDIKNTTGSYDVIISNDYNISGTGSSLEILGNIVTNGGIFESCDTTVLKNKSLEGTALFLPIVNDSEIIRTYCDFSNPNGVLCTGTGSKYIGSKCFTTKLYEYGPNRITTGNKVLKISDWYQGIPNGAQFKVSFTTAGSSWSYGNVRTQIFTKGISYGPVNMSHYGGYRKSNYSQVRYDGNDTILFSSFYSGDDTYGRRCKIKIIDIELL